MSEHEVWNELGNLYCISGMLDQATYAYSRAIKLQNKYGLPYSNLAYVKLQQGNLEEAADLYKIGIDLLVEDHDKAVSWYRLGDVFRRLKNYRDAIMAYQQADALDTEASKHFEAAQVFLYGPSNIPFDAIPSIVNAAPKEESVAENLISTEDTPLQALTTNNDVPDVDAETVVSEEPTNSSDTQSAQSDDEQILQSIYEFANMYIPESDDVAENNVSEHIIEPELEEELNQIANVDLVYEPVEVNEPVVFAQQHLDFDLPDSSPQSTPEIMADIPSQIMLVDYKSQITEGQRATYAFTDVAVMEDERKNEAMYVFVREEESTVEVQPEPAILQKTEEKELERRNVESNQNISEQLLEAIAQLESYLNRNPRNARKWNELSSLYNSAGMYERSIRANQQATKLVPNSPVFLYELGVSYGAAGRYDDAIDCMQKVIELNPEHCHAHATLSGYYRKIGLEEMADQHIGDAMKNYIDDENQYNRACLEALRGNVESAVENLRNALESKQIYIEWVLRDPDLDSIRFTSQFKSLLAEYAM